MTLVQEKGALVWLTALQIDDHGFTLSKEDFRDALCPRYGWQPSHLPSHCSDGETFTVEHALSCRRYVALCHEIRNVLTELLAETCHNVASEPPLKASEWRATTILVRHYGQ